LVLHGGTGLTEQDFQNCLQNGIKKINIATASYDSVAREIKAVQAAKPDAGYFDFSDAAVQGTYKNIKKHMLIFGLQGKA
jgi:fructose-bisphosphate aldolase class II